MTIPMMTIRCLTAAAGRNRPKTTSAREERRKTAKRALEPRSRLFFDDYKDTGDFWFINMKYPGLRAIHKDPWFFVVPNLLSPEQCTALIMKGNPHVSNSMSTKADGTQGTSDTRTSQEMRFSYEEVPAIQQIFSKVLNMPVKNVEPLKLIKYAKGGKFKIHHDSLDPSSEPQEKCPGVPYANRVVKLFVYLTDCEQGGETQFTRYGLKVPPRAGMGVIHFPAYLPTSEAYTATKAPQAGAKVTVQVKDKGSFMGTVVKMNADGTAVIEKDDSGKKIKYAEENFAMLPNLKGQRDEHAVHEGLSAIDEKLIVSQWCYPGEYQLAGEPKVAEMTRPLNG
jgi:hypothetical protein